MNSLFLEEPLLLGAVLATALLVLAGIWSRSRSPGATRALLAGAVIAPVLLFVQHLVQTDGEKLQSRLQDMADTVATGRVNDIVGFVSQQARFDGGRYTRADFEQTTSSLLSQCTVENPRVFSMQLAIHDRQAEVTCRSTCTVATARWTQAVNSRWRITLELQDGAWMITNIQPMEIQGQRYSSLWDIRIP